ncbi:MAG: hypothetical protein NC930_05060 [Candidatus Omnitrophica bacterium]|nr:hypothetical protein [Candidatus Omnitrophota bacterium]
MAAFETRGVKSFYLEFELDRSHFRRVMRGMRALALDGFNITGPYKEEVVGYLDGMTSEAKAIRAVNTVFRKGNRWIGANTDVDGFLTSLVGEGKFCPRGKKI